jgi:DNA-binding beta-propeller fold protein YncE
MKSIVTHPTVTSGAKAAVLGLALIGLVNCSSSDNTTPQVAPGGSAGLSSPLVFVNNTGDKTLTSVALKGDSGNAVVGAIPAAEFENVALGDMQFSDGDWLFLNLAASNKVATIDPLTGATPIHEANLATGTRPVHIYRDSNDGEVVWSMNDGDNAGGTLTPGDDLVNCASQGGGSVTALHNSHLGPGGTPPFVLGTTCLLADGHKVAAFSSGAGVPKRVFVTSEDAGEMAVIEDDEASADYRKMIKRIDLCNSAKETTPCNNESATPITTAFTPNSSTPHGIRLSKLTKKVYSILEGYHNIVEIDPTTLAITKTFDLTGTPYTSYGISPDGRFLLLRGNTTPPTGTKLGVVDLSTAATPRTDFTISELDGTSTGSFKFSPDGKRFYILAGNTAASTKKDRLFAFDASTLTATPPALTLIKEISLLAGGDSVGFSAAHSLDVLAQGAGEAKYIVVSNKADNSLSIINTTDNLIKQTVTNVGSLPGSVIVYAPGTAAAGNQATASLTGGSQAKSSALPDQLDDHGMLK